MAAPRRRRPGHVAEPTNSGVEDYRHADTRLNNPPAGLVSYEPRVREPKRHRYAYDPHLSPQLVWAGKAGLKSIEVEDAAGVEVEEVALHVHERVSTRAIINAVRRPEPRQMALFADPELPLAEAVKFYQHEQDWANRLILGDSLLVMNSLLSRELMASKVQMIYVDPPYGVKFASNFQPRIDQRDVRDGDEHLTREPEMIKAYRDTWTLGVHSYLTYLRDRLSLCRELLTESGSIFVQISNENVHRVRNLLDELFGPENFCSQITFRKTTGAGSPSGSTTLLAQTCDYLLWYAKEKGSVKYRTTHFERHPSDDTTNFRWAELPDGTRRQLTRDELDNVDRLPAGWRVFRMNPLTSQTGGPSTRFEFEFEGKPYRVERSGGWKTTITGMNRLAAADRLIGSGNTLGFVRFFDDFKYQDHNDIWDDTRQSGFGEPKVFVVQTVPRVIERCVLMTTDPGDLVLDPTCGGGTTAYVAEQRGRR